MPKPLQPLLTTLLDGVVSGFAEAGVVLPTVQYVAPGIAVAYDEDQLTTSLTRLYPGRPGAESGWQYSYEQVFAVELQVNLVRSVSVVQESGAPPSVAALQADAALFLQDVDTLSAVLVDIVNNYLIAPQGVPCVFLGVDTYGPMGGVVASIGKVGVALL